MPCHGGSQCLGTLRISDPPRLWPLCKALCQSHDRRTACKRRRLDRLEVFRLRVLSYRQIEVPCTPRPSPFSRLSNQEYSLPYCKHWPQAHKACFCKYCRDLSSICAEGG